MYNWLCIELKTFISYLQKNGKTNIKEMVVSITRYRTFPTVQVYNRSYMTKTQCRLSESYYWVSHWCNYAWSICNSLVVCNNM